jgi:hypothetical protein
MKLQRFDLRTLGCLLFPLLVLLLPRSAAGQIPTQSNASTAIVFYADRDVQDTIWPALFDAFPREVAREEGEYPLPMDAQPIKASSLTPGEDFAQIIEVRLIGRCDVVQQAYRPIRRGPLGWVLRVSGEVQPFVFVDCARLAQVLNPKTLGMNDEQRRNAMAQAISRITIHEWIHIEMQSGDHENHGIRRPELSADDLTHPAQVSGGR